MLLYLLKVTLFWAVFLLLFEALYKKGAHFNGNRVYLLLALFIGTLLPLVTIPLPDSVAGANVMDGLQRVRSGTLNRELIVASGNNKVINWKMLLEIVYGTGAVIFLALNIREIFLIIRHAIYGNYEEWHHHKIFTGQKVHAPYSFMGWVFIRDPAHYKEQELDYILKHELAHSKNLHWLDLLIMQFFCILFWFHPLVWRYRHLLKLEQNTRRIRKRQGKTAMITVIFY
jgi:beta-lactamase regulating signal transducer with metallopeptidase domain